MKTQISRDGFRADRRYSGVYQQQGRMITDRDWNELVDVLKTMMNGAMSQVIGAGKQATPITLRTFFENHEPIDAGLTVPMYLGRLATSATTILNAKDYGQTVYDLAIRRQLITIGEDMVNTAYDSPVDAPPESQITEAEGKLFSLAETGKFGQGFLGFNEALKNAIEMAANAYERQGGLSGISSGLRDLDGRMGGLQSSDLIILAGRPSMGKTSLVTNIAYHVARNFRTERQADGTDKAVDGGVVGFFSLEMSAEQLATRILSEQAGIGSEKIRRGMISEPEFKQLVSVSQEMAAIPLYIDQTGGISIAQLSARARRLVATDRRRRRLTHRARSQKAGRRRRPCDYSPCGKDL